MNDLIMSSGQFMTFITVLAAGLAYILATGLFGAMGGHGDHVADGHSAEHVNDTVSIFSPKIIAIFMVGFGAGGSLATHAGLHVLGASFTGLGSGLFLGAIALVGLRLLYSQQSNSEITASDALGHVATVSTAIPANGLGEVETTIRGQLLSYRARAITPFSKGSSVKITAINGTEVTVS